MVSVRNKGLYEGEDLVDKFLLDTVSKHMNHDELSDFKKHLKVKDQAFENIASPDD